MSMILPSRAMAQYSSESLGSPWVRTASGWKRRPEEPDAGDHRSGARVDDGNREHPATSPGRSGEVACGGNFERTENVLIESETIECQIPIPNVLEGQIRVIIPNVDRPLVYLDTSRMGLLYEPEVKEGNLSTNFMFPPPSNAEVLMVVLKSQIIEGVTGKVSRRIGTNEYEFTFQPTNEPSVLVADPGSSGTTPTRYAVYTDVTEGGQTRRAYLLPNNTEDPGAQQNPRRRTITAHVDPDTDTDLHVFEVDFGSITPLFNCLIS